MSVARGSQLSLRRCLLGTASGAALVGSAPFAAQADTSIDHIYLDFSGQYSLWSGGSMAWGRTFFTFPEPRIQVRNGWDTRGDIALQSGDWYLTLSADYGRTGVSHNDISQKYGPFTRSGQAKHDESHTIVDFTMGKDIGLGTLGLDGSSIISGGIRYERFIGHTVANISSFNYTARKYIDQQFLGFGPVISWKARTPICPEWYFSWGVTAAAVLGARSFELDPAQPILNPNRHKRIMSPALSGYLGATWQMPDSPLTLSARYRADAFFSVYDSGFQFGDERAHRVSHGPEFVLTWQVY